MAFGIPVSGSVKRTPGGGFGLPSSRGGHSVLLMRVKALFFDEDCVKRAVNEARRAVLSKGGAYVRQEARLLIKQAPRIPAAELRDKRTGRYRARASRPRAHSKPGNPPYSHVGLLRRFILFSYDPEVDTVVVGPAKLSQRGDVPHVLEFGGFTTSRRGRSVVIEPRPYMEPALEKVRLNLRPMWRDSVRSTV